MAPPAGATAPSARPLPRPAARPRTRTAPVRPRRVSGPVHAPAGRPARATQPPPAQEGLALGVLGAARVLAGHRVLDRLIRGRAWIALIAFALIGIVTLQLLVLALNARIGRALVREGRLQRENAALSIEGSELAAGERVEAQAARLGMQLVPIGSLRFLTADPSADLARAAAALNTPVHGSPDANGASAAPPEAGAGAAGTATQEANAAGAAGAPGAATSEAASAEAAGEGAGASATTATTPTTAAQGATQAQTTPTGAATTPSTPAASAGAGAASAGAGAAGGEDTPASSAGGVGVPAAAQPSGSG